MDQASERYRALLERLAKESSVAEAAEKLGISRAYAYRILKRDDIRTIGSRAREDAINALKLPRDYFDAPDHAISRGVIERSMRQPIVAAGAVLLAEATQGDVSESAIENLVRGVLDLERLVDAARAVANAKGAARTHRALLLARDVEDMLGTGADV